MQLLDDMHMLSLMSSMAEDICTLKAAQQKLDELEFLAPYRDAIHIFRPKELV